MLSPELILIWLQVGGIVGGVFTIMCGIYYKINISPIKIDITTVKQECEGVKESLHDFQKEVKTDMDKIHDKCNDLENKDIEHSVNIDAMKSNVDRLINKMDDVINMLIRNKP